MAQMVSFDALRQDVEFVESLGFPAVWLVDQLWVDPSLRDVPVLEPWTALAGLAATTSTVRLGTAVTNAAMRHPGLLARTILAVDDISRGRVDVGVGAGYSDDELRALGLPVLPPRDHVSRFTEVVAALDQALSGGSVTIDSDQVQLDDVPMLPRSSQQPRPPLWVAANGRRSMRAAVRHADGVMTFCETPDADTALATFIERMSRLDGLAEEADRDPASIRRCYFTGGSPEPVFASPQATIDLVGRYTGAGATDLTLYLTHPDAGFARGMTEAGLMATRDQLAEVAPALLSSS